MKKKKIVVIGGGTGTSVVLEGLKKYSVDLSAVITTADDGSSSGVLRREFRMIPPGDIRQCVVALASKDFRYLNERFQKGFLQGHTLGNLLITLFSQRNKNFQEAVDELLQLVGAEGSLIPMTSRPVTLVAHLTDGTRLVGESTITPSRVIRRHLKKLSIFPRAVHANPRAILAIQDADCIVVGPGNLFSSVIPVLLVPEIRRALRNSSAKKIYVTNLFTQPGHTDGFTVVDFLEVLKTYIGEDIFSHVLYNTARVSSSLVSEFRNGSVGEEVAFPIHLKKDRRFRGRALFQAVPRRGLGGADPLRRTRNPFLHDAKKVAKAIMEII